MVPCNTISKRSIHIHVHIYRQVIKTVLTSWKYTCNVLVILVSGSFWPLIPNSTCIWMIKKSKTTCHWFRLEVFTNTSTFLFKYRYLKLGCCVLLASFVIRQFTVTINYTTFLFNHLYILMKVISWDMKYCINSTKSNHFPFCGARRL